MYNSSKKEIANFNDTHKESNCICITAPYSKCSIL